MRLPLLALVGSIIVLLAAPSVCAQARLVQPREKAEESGWWWMALVRDDGVKIPFLLYAPREGEEQPFIRNGEEKIPVDAAWEGETLTLDFPHYDSRLIATLTDSDQPLRPDRVFEGEWRKTARGEVRVMKVDGNAAINGHWRQRFSGALRPDAIVTRAAPVDVFGVWRMNFADSGVAKGVFHPIEKAGEQGRRIGEGVRGTVRTPTGDYRFLAGMNDGRLALSVFDGAHAFLITGALERGGDRMTGFFYSGNHWKEAFSAERVPEGEDFTLPDPFEDTSVTTPDRRLRLPQLQAPPYADRPVIVSIFGTWCPNCHDEASALVDLYERYHDEGLQILGLAYEHTGADERARRQVERFKEKYGIDWRIVVAGSSDKQQASATLPAVDRIRAFPTTIFLNRDHTVRAVHSGFSGPATGDAHDELLERFDQLTRDILSSEP